MQDKKCSENGFIRTTQLHGHRAIEEQWSLLTRFFRLSNSLDYSKDLIHSKMRISPIGLKKDPDVKKLVYLTVIVFLSSFQVEFNGLTGHINFLKGQRTNVRLRIVKLKPAGEQTKSAKLCFYST